MTDEEIIRKFNQMRELREDIFNTIKKQVIRLSFKDDKTPEEKTRYANISKAYNMLLDLGVLMDRGIKL